MGLYAADIMPDELHATGKEAHARLGLEYPGAGASPKKEGWRVPPAGKEARTSRLVFGPPTHEPEHRGSLE